MSSIYRGEPITNKDFINQLDQLKPTLEADLLMKRPNQELVINAIAQLASEINRDEIIHKLTSLGLPKWAIEDYLKVFINSLTKEALQQKVNRELGNNPFEWEVVTEDIEEKMAPLGVVMHIGAGNALGLSAFSVLEGLLTGNINILKLPTEEGGMSSEILLRLLEIEPKLKPYIYVVDVSSKNETVIRSLIECVDAVAVWGANETIKVIREMTPPTISLIEWGHRLSFAYFTKLNRDDLKRLAEDVVLTEQLYCSSPQCVFYETESKEALNDFATALSDALNNVSKKYPSSTKTIDVASQITWTHELIKMEELLNEKKLLSEDVFDYSVMVDYNPKLIPSPLFRNIWVMPVKRNEIFNVLRVSKGNLQTVGLSCDKSDLDELSALFYSAGVNRIMNCGNMSSNYSGEPHDGVYALRQYVRVVNRVKSN